MSSPTIVPPEILCCGPLGSLRYYKVSISGVVGTCPQCTTGCNCDGINGDYIFDMLLGPLNPHGPCISELTLSPPICGYALISFAIVTCQAGKSNFVVTLSGTGSTTPAINIVWKKEEIEDSMDPQSLPWVSQLGSECNPTASIANVVPLAPSAMTAIQDSCFPRRPSVETSTNPPDQAELSGSNFPDSCGCGASATHGLMPINAASGGCSDSDCGVTYNVENGNIALKLVSAEWRRLGTCAFL